ncbi:MAG: OsmC family protein [Armatimonadetes bacterium]|nr:OsmC family protein [Armatimonadota bacterium]
MVEMDVVYEGGLRCLLTHGPSGSEVRTDAPVDNHGRGELFSPTDLVSSALGACLLTIMGILAERHTLDLTGARVHVSKEMTDTPPRRIARLTCAISVPPGVPEELRPAFERSLRTCPVAQSLHPDIEKVIEFAWDVA